jgi:hypothetical protein
MSKITSNSMIHTYKGWEVIQHFYDNGTNNFSAYRNREPLKDSEGTEIFANTLSEMDGTINNMSEWGGPREGAGRPSTGRKAKPFYVTDEEYIKLKEYLEQLRASQK